MPLQEIDHHDGLCTWFEGDVRCRARGVMGSAKTALCEVHLDAHRKLSLEPEAYQAWRAQRDAARAS